jgi:hypothetical protein
LKNVLDQFATENAQKCQNLSDPTFDEVALIKLDWDLGVWTRNPRFSWLLRRKIRFVWWIRAKTASLLLYDALCGNFSRCGGPIPLAW